MAGTMETELPLRLVLKGPLDGVDYGIQVGKGKDYETTLVQRGKGADLVFEFSIPVKGARKDGGPNFIGPMAQGQPAARFFYVDIGKYAGRENQPHSCRMKIPLEFDWETVDAVTATPGARLEGWLPGDVAATIRPADGWKIVSPP